MKSSQKAKVEKALLRLATGIKSTEERELLEQDAKGEKRRVERVTREIPPDLGAIRMLMQEEKVDAGIEVVTFVPRPEKNQEA